MQLFDIRNDSKVLGEVNYDRVESVLLVRSSDEAIHKLFISAVKNLRWLREGFDSNHKIEHEGTITKISNLDDSEWVVLRNKLMTYLNLLVK
jgi:hypothetical protein